MDFLNKIKSYISIGWKKQWKKEIQIEKKKKYLFGSIDQDSSFQWKRKKKFFHTQNENLIAFSNFFQDKIFTKDIFHTYGQAMSIIGLILIFLSVYIVIFSPYFKISPNRVIVEAMSPGIDIAIAYRTLESTYWESIFLIDESEIATKLKSQLNNITAIDIGTLYPNGLKVLITGAPILFDVTITGIPNKKWGLSKNGVLVPETDIADIKTQHHLNITGSNLIGDFFLNYKQGITESNMWLIIKIYEIFGSEWPNLKIWKSQYFAWENELHITMENGTKIIFTLQNDTDKQNGPLPKYILDQLVTLRTYISNNSETITSGSITYIDARIPGKLFICSDKTLCPKNLVTIYWDTYK